VAKRKVSIVTGSRCSYGIYIPVLREIEARPDLDYSLIVTGMHLSPKYGNTINEIVADGFKIDAKVDMLPDSDTGAAQAKSLGLAVLGMTQAFEQTKPDVILISGDRAEILAAAIAGAHMSIPVLHMDGGEESGTIDNAVRHATTRFAHVHCATTMLAAERLIRMGEEPQRVHLVGAAAIEYALNLDLEPPEQITTELGLDHTKPIIIVLQHPVTGETEDSGRQMEETLKAVEAVGEQAVIIGPNSDPGNDAMWQAIDRFMNEENKKATTVFRVNLPFVKFLSLMKTASVMVGNSSGAIVEAPSLGLPVVDIGTRQTGREKAGNVIEAGYDWHEITVAIRKALTDREFIARVKEKKTPYDPYGDGKTAGRIVDIILELEVTPELLNKRLTF